MRSVAMGHVWTSGNRGRVINIPRYRDPGPDGAPAGEEKNLVQTIPGKSWNTFLRLYGPLQPFFDKTWRPGEIELQL
jgi:hypothetical protein